MAFRRVLGERRKSEGRSEDKGERGGGKVSRRKRPRGITKGQLDQLSIILSRVWIFQSGKKSRLESGKKSRLSSSLINSKTKYCCQNYIASTVHVNTNTFEHVTSCGGTIASVCCGVESIVWI